RRHGDPVVSGTPRPRPPACRSGAWLTLAACACLERHWSITCKRGRTCVRCLAMQAATGCEAREALASAVATLQALDVPALPDAEVEALVITVGQELAKLGVVNARLAASADARGI